MKVIENKVFKNAPAMQIEVSKNSDGEVLIAEGDKVMWLSNTAALDLAEWILDKVSEVEEC